MVKVISIDKKFFYLFKNDKFSFKNSNNFLNNCYNITLAIKKKNTFERNIENTAVIGKKNEKFQFQLKGKGSLQQLPNELFFLSSKLVLEYSDDNKRIILFNYLFEKNNIPYEDKEENINDLEEKSNLFFMPIIQVVVSEQIVDGSNWQLILDEI